MESADQQVVIDLERQHGQALFGFVLRLGLSDVEARDAVQEVLLRVWSQLVAGTVIESPRSWAFRSIYRLAMDEHRLRRRAAGLIQHFARDNNREVRRDVDDGLAVWAEVERLPERQRAVLYLRYRADLRFDEIGHVLGISSSASRSHATQAIAKLRDRLTTDTDR